MRTLKNLVMAVALSSASLVDVRAALASTETVDQSVSDAMMSIGIKTELINKLGVDAMGITVSAAADTITLSGDVRRPSSKALAEQVALAVRGVGHVDNQIVENPRPSTSAATKASMRNALLEMKVKAALLGEIGTNAMKLDVEGSDGVVSLRGTLGDQDLARSAIRKAQSVKGVRRVVNLIN